MANLISKKVLKKKSAVKSNAGPVERMEAYQNSKLLSMANKLKPVKR